MSDEAKQLYDAACEDFSRRLKRLAQHMKCSAIAVIVVRALGWINIPVSFAGLLVILNTGEVSMLLLCATLGMSVTVIVIGKALSFAYSHQLKQCHELDAVAIAIRDLSANNPEWRKGSNIELIEAEVK